MGAPSPPPRPAPVLKPVAVDATSQDTEQRQARADKKKMGRNSLIVNRGGAQGLGGGDDNASIKKKTLG
jgi:hypothetical protein|tara:strand:+ start:103 stop:309 length:207 start_codon:yes stop_codon:yes gene_type:complete